MIASYKFEDYRDCALLGENINSPAHASLRNAYTSRLNDTSRLPEPPLTQNALKWLYRIAFYMDGSVRFFRKSIPEKVLRALITPFGDEVIDWSWDK